MKTKEHRFEILVKRIVKCLGDGYVMSAVIHGLFGCSVYVECQGRLVWTGGCGRCNLELACKDLIDRHFILGNCADDSLGVSTSYSELEMKLSLRGF